MIEQVLNCLERMVDESGARGRLEAEPASSAVEFFRMFADRCHHGKEEVHLFPAMEAKGFPREGGPTGVMLHEHKRGRGHVRAMDEAIAGAAAGEAEALSRFRRHGLAYAELLRQHIEKEDHCLFTMANQAFSHREQEELLAIFERVESEEMGEGTHEKYVKIADDLAERYGVPKAQASHAGHGCGCGH